MKNKTESILSAIDKAVPTTENLARIRQKIVAKFGELENWPYIIDKTFEEFEVSVKICAGEKGGKPG